MKNRIVILILFSLFLKMEAQEIESVYLFEKKKKFSNVYKNYSETDSLILFKNKTFRKNYSYIGFDDINKTVFTGNWKKNKRAIVLHVNKKIDSINIMSVIPFTINYRIKMKSLKPTDEKSRKLKRIK